MSSKLAELEAAQTQIQGTLGGLVEQLAELRTIVFDSNVKLQEVLDQKAAADGAAAQLQQLIGTDASSFNFTVYNFSCLLVIFGIVKYCNASQTVFLNEKFGSAKFGQSTWI